jgi:hypothetical protein
MVVAWLALVLSLVSVGVTVWDHFLRRSKFAVQADWILSGERPVLRIVVLNVGDRKDTIRDIRLKEAPQGPRGWTPWESVMSKLPIVLEPDAASPPFLIELEPHGGPFNILQDALRTSRIDALDVENARGWISTFELPALYQAQQNAETNAGPQLAKTIP